MLCSSSFDVKLYNAGESAVDRIDIICSSSLEQGNIFVIFECCINDNESKLLIMVHNNIS